MLDVGQVRLVERGQVAHAVAADVLKQRLASGEQGGGEEDPLPQSGLGDLEPAEAAPVEHRLERQRGGEDDVAAAGLDAGKPPPLAHRQTGELLDQLAEDLAGEHEPLDAAVRRARPALGGGGEVARCSADGDQPSSTLAQPAELGEGVTDVDAQAPHRLARGLALSGQKTFGEPDGPQRERYADLFAAVGDGDELEAPATEVDHGAVAEGRRVDRRQVAVTRFFGLAQHLDPQAGSTARRVEQLVAVGGIADGARGHRPHVAGGELVGLAEPGEHVEGLQPAGDRRGGEDTGGPQSFPDPHRLVQLVGQLPPRPRQVGEDDQPPRVGAQVDDGRLPRRGPVVDGVPAHGHG